MKHISLGALDVSRIGLGAMSMSGYYNIGAGSDTESIRTFACHSHDSPAARVLKWQRKRADDVEDDGLHFEVSSSASSSHSPDESGQVQTAVKY